MEKTSSYHANSFNMVENKQLANGVVNDLHFSGSATLNSLLSYYLALGDITLGELSKLSGVPESSLRRMRSNSPKGSATNCKHMLDILRVLIELDLLKELSHANNLLVLAGCKKLTPANSEERALMTKLNNVSYVSQGNFLQTVLVKGEKSMYEGAIGILNDRWESHSYESVNLLSFGGMWERSKFKKPWFETLALYIKHHPETRLRILLQTPIYSELFAYMLWMLSSFKDLGNLGPPSQCPDVEIRSLRTKKGELIPQLANSMVLFGSETTVLAYSTRRGAKKPDTALVLNDVDITKTNVASFENYWSTYEPCSDIIMRSRWVREDKPDIRFQDGIKTVQQAHQLVFIDGLPTWDNTELPQIN